MNQQRTRQKLGKGQPGDNRAMGQCYNHTDRQEGGFKDVTIGGKAKLGDEVGGQEVK